MHKHTIIDMCLINVGEFRKNLGISRENLGRILNFNEGILYVIKERILVGN